MSAYALPVGALLLGFCSFVLAMIESIAFDRMYPETMPAGSEPVEPR